MQSTTALLLLLLLGCLSSFTYGAKITVLGAGKGVTIVSGNSTSRVFDVIGATTALEIRDLTVSDGFQAFGGVAAFDDVGGAIRLVNALELTIVNCTLENNDATASGGSPASFMAKGGGAVGVVCLAASSVTTNVTILDTWLLDNSAAPVTDVAGEARSVYGGAVLLSADDSGLIILTVERCQFARNDVVNSDGGGVVAVGNLQVAISDTTFDNNTASETGASDKATVAGALRFAQYNGLAATVYTMTATLTRCTFQGSRATARGGAVSVNEMPSLGLCTSAIGTVTSVALTDCTFTDNRVSRAPLTAFVTDIGGGAMMIDCPSASVTIEGSTFLENRVESLSGVPTVGDGGAILARDGVTLVVTETLFERNFARCDGGALYVNAMTSLTMNRCTVRNNTVIPIVPTHFGGGLDCIGSTCSLSRCTFSGNAAASGGGLFALAQSGNAVNLTLSQCTFHKNTASFIGGGVLFGTVGANDVTAALTACTITENAASSNVTAGGGVSSAEGLGFPLSAPSLVTLRSTIVANNTGTYAGQSLDVSIPSVTNVASGGFNLIQDQTGTIVTVLLGSDLVAGLDPLLGVLGANGGFTETQRPLAASPAIDSGDSALNSTLAGTDQRFAGFSRFISTQVDVGAVEVQDLCVGVVCDDGDPCTVDTCTDGLCANTPITSMGEYKDNFVAMAYNNTEVSLDWSPFPWVETGDDGLATLGGTLFIVGGTLHFSLSTTTSAVDVNITRTAPVPLGVTAVLSVRVFSVTNVLWVTEVSSTGAEPFTALECFHGGLSNATCVALFPSVPANPLTASALFMYDVTAFASPDMAVRFRYLEAVGMLTAPARVLIDFASVTLGTVICDDGLACTVGDMCTAGTCMGTPSAAFCDDGNACTVDSCNATSGQCINTALSAGTVCRASTDPCDPAETCDGTTAPCPADVLLADGAFCDVPPTGPCGNQDTCLTGACLEGGANDALCDDGFLCSTATCNVTTQVCQQVLLNDTVCLTAGAACAVDTCSPANTMPPPDAAGCIHLASDLLCVDGLFCNGMEFCNSTTFQCQVNTTNTAAPPFCSDGIACTVDTCDEATDMCVNTPDNAFCADNNTCTIDKCTETGCVSFPITSLGSYQDQFSVVAYNNSNGVGDDWSPFPWVETGDDASPSTGALFVSVMSDVVFTLAINTSMVNVNITRKVPMPANITAVLTVDIISADRTIWVIEVSADELTLPFEPLECFHGDLSNTTCVTLFPSVPATSAGQPGVIMYDISNFTGPHTAIRFRFLETEVSLFNPTATVAISLVDVTLGTISCDDGLDCTVMDMCDDGLCVGTPSDAFCDDSNVCTINTCNATTGQCVFTVNTGAVCRASTGPCDAQELCLPDATCPPDTFQPSTVECRASAGSCDVAESCTGSSAACPADSLLPSTTECRASAGACDTAENCTGSSATCPADAFEPSTLECRPSAGLCDIAEDCTGSSATCPADALEPTTTVCRPAADVCDVEETCTGFSPLCQIDTFSPSSQVCRASVDLCDVQETCTGFSAPCPADGFEPTSTVCRTSAGVCDIEETCTGTGALCPAVDVKEPTTTVCRTAAGSCDVAENCDGTTDFCPADGFEPSTLECRASAGACDVAENCTGSTATCPADALEPSTTVCRPSVDVCDVEETCSGVSPLCQPDVFAPSSQVCRNATGACDVQETCTGTSAPCPADGFAPATLVCRNATDVCDLEETCTGTGALCPVDFKEPTTTVCRTAAGVCDVAENCDGVADACPADALQPPTLECRATAGACDVAENCTGSGATCPADVFEPGSAVCRASAGLCDAQETCSGSGPVCPADVKQPNGTLCRSSAGVCDVQEVCDGVADACPTDVFSTLECRASAGQCDAAENCTGSAAPCPADVAVAAGTPCDDGLFCSVADMCSGFACNVTTPRDCSDGVACTMDSCSEVLDVCLNMANDTFCNNGAFCDGAEFCNTTSDCQPGTPVDCNDGVMCTSDVCNETNDMCMSTANDTLCDDGNVCNGLETCNAVSDCQAGTALDCSSFDGPCSVGMCNNVTGCFAAPLSNGTLCRSSLGVCDPQEVCNGVSLLCPLDTLLSNTTVCRASGGVCDVEELCDGTSPLCPADGFETSMTVCRASVGVCDVNETCSGVGALCPADALLGNGTSCRASNGTCDLEEFCNGVSGLCPTDTKEANGTVCRPQASTCDVEETCDGVGDACPADMVAPASTECRASLGVCDVAENCTGSSPTCPADAFQPSSLVCRGVAGVCDVAEQCPGTGPTCPADAFTPSGAVCRASVGFCDPEELCNGTMAACPVDIFLASGTPCNEDMDLCTVDTCNAGAMCVPSGGALDCDDGVSCTNDTCLPLSGCQNTPDDSQCDDSNPCTMDTCNPTTGCVNAVIPFLCAVEVRVLLPHVIV